MDVDTLQIDGHVALRNCGQIGDIRLVDGTTDLAHNGILMPAIKVTR